MSRIYHTHIHTRAPHQYIHTLTIQSFATLSVYGIPPLLDRETIVILVFCLLLILGAIILLAMSIRQRYVYVQ